MTSKRLKRKLKLKKPRNMVVLGMLIACKGGVMKDKRAKREGELERKDITDQLDEKHNDQ